MLAAAPKNKYHSVHKIYSYSYQLSNSKILFLPFLKIVINKIYKDLQNSDIKNTYIVVRKLCPVRGVCKNI